ncbi:MAG: S1C family serine protease, partial [bacterium]
LATSWKVGLDLVNPNTAGSGGDGTQSEKSGTGTAFAITPSGLALTSHHIVEDAKNIRVAGHDGEVRLVAVDKANDLAIVQLPFRPEGTLSFRSDASRPGLGDDVVVYGYPLSTLLSSGGNVTTGTLSALTGMGNNASHIQITAPIQPGSSGSPVFDRTGNVIGIVASKLNEASAVEMTGTASQTVNFAVNIQTIEAFLDASEVKYRKSWPWPSFERSTRQITNSARKSVFMLEVGTR